VPAAFFAVIQMMTSPIAAKLLAAKRQVPRKDAASRTL
jgi:predicted Na+-dependent transporter